MVVVAVGATLAVVTAVSADHREAAVHQTVVAVGLKMREEKRMNLADREMRIQIIRDKLIKTKSYSIICPFPV